MIETAEQKFQKGSEEWMMFQEYYKIVQEFYIPEDTDKYWGGLHEAVTTFEKKYSIPLAKHLAVAMYRTMDEVFNSVQ